MVHSRMDKTGDFVITWSSYNQDGDLWGVYAVHIDAGLNVINPEFKVNTYTTGKQKYSRVAMDDSGDFVIAWQSYGQDGDDSGIYAQRYDSNGTAQGSEFNINTYTTGKQAFPSVSMDSAGDFVVTWSSYAQYNVYAQRYDSNGAQVNSEFQVNTYATNQQFYSVVKMDSAGDFVTSWISAGEDGDNFGIYAQRGVPQ